MLGGCERQDRADSALEPTGEADSGDHHPQKEADQRRGRGGHQRDADANHQTYGSHPGDGCWWSRMKNKH